MKLRVPSVIVGVVAVLVLAYVASFRNQLQKLPRLRVGPLHQSHEVQGKVRLFALGDTGSGGESQYRVAAAMEARCKQQGGIDAILLLGDNAYQNGMQTVDDPQWKTKVWDPYGSECLSQAPIYPVLGNHDYKGNPQAQIDHTLVNKRWRFPNRFYDVRFGEILELVAFDSEMSETCLRPTQCTVDFMADSLANSVAPWKIVIAHHPLAASSGHGFSHNGGLRGFLLKPYLCDKADAWLSGHVHHLEHLAPKDCRLQLFISGGGGGELYTDVDRDEDSQFVSPVNGFLALELDAAAMKSEFVGVDGQTLHQTVKTKGGAQP